jgi:hypothetical protein
MNPPPLPSPTARSGGAGLGARLLALGLALFGAEVGAQTTTVAPGTTVTFSAEADGSRPFTYEWRRDGQPVAGASQSVLVLASAQPGDSGAYEVIIRNALGAATSNRLMLVVLAAPGPEPAGRDVTIVSPPVAAAAAPGEIASLSVAGASAAGLPLSYQWRRDGLNLPGATGALLTLGPLTAGDFGQYSVVVQTAAGAVTSPPAELRRLGASGGTPGLAGLPAALELAAGGTLVLAAQPTGEPRPNLQWRRDGVELPGATGELLVVAEAKAGTYAVTARNLAGSVTGATRVSVGAAAGRLVNLSTRGPAGAGDDSLIVGFVLAGTGGRELLMRAIGPTLAAFGVEGSLADPVLEVRDAGGRLVRQNQDWGETAANAVAVNAAGAGAGAFPLPTGSRDAAAVAGLASGAYTMQVTGVGPAVGQALAEAYALGGPAAGPALANLSTRSRLGATGEPLVAGFVVAGPAAKTVLVRAVGPTLAVFGVTGSLARPQLRLYDAAQRLVAANAAWEAGHAGEALLELMVRAGAFPLPRGSADAGLALTLPPGAYTAEIRGSGGAGGVALLEIYELR